MWMQHAAIMQVMFNPKLTISALWAAMLILKGIGRQNCIDIDKVLCREVETLFHECGHALQHMLTQQEEGLVAGIR